MPSRKKNGARPVVEGIPEELFVLPYKIPDRFHCSICLEVSCDAMYTPCDHLFCEVCIQKMWTVADEICFECPNCRKECYHVEAAELAREVLANQLVFCSEVEELRCHWVGPYRMLSSHLANGCPKTRMADRMRGRRTKTMGHTSFTRPELARLSCARLKDIIDNLLTRDALKSKATLPRFDFTDKKKTTDKIALLKAACELLQFPYELDSATDTLTADISAPKSTSTTSAGVSETDPIESDVKSDSISTETDVVKLDDGGVEAETTGISAKSTESTLPIGIVKGVSEERLLSLPMEELMLWLSVRRVRCEHASVKRTLVDLVLHVLDVIGTGDGYEVEMERESISCTHPSYLDKLKAAETEMKESAGVSAMRVSADMESKISAVLVSH